MLSEIKQLIRSDRKIQLILWAGLIIQIAFCITAVGYYHPDQHFQLVEFSSYQLGRPSGASYVWEMTHFVRPTLQVYIFSGYYKFCSLFGIHDPFAQLTILRFILGLGMYFLFNLIALYYFKSGKRAQLYWVLLILNFSWIFPYTRTLFSSEMLASFFLFGTLFLYDVKRKERQSFLFLCLIGFLLGISFYLRFQAGFAIAGFGLWMLFVEKKYFRLFPIALGFLVALAINVWLDHHFYGEWVFTPYRYFFVNINEGRAASFGSSSFLRYVGLLVAVLTSPPFSIILLFCALVGFFKKYDYLLSPAVFLFILGHCVVGHKEERFLFTIFNIMPVIIGWGLAGLFNYYERCGKWMAALLHGLMIITIVLNTALLFLLMLNPYSQSIAFAKKLKARFKEPVTVYCLSQTPLETESRAPVIFYKSGMANIDLRKITYNDSVKNLEGHNVYVAATFNQVNHDRALLDSLGFHPVMYSSRLLWHINEWLASKKRPAINEIWVLYKKE